MKYKLFIGRWSPFHKGHQTIIDSFVKNGVPVCIAVRQSDEAWSVGERMAFINQYYKEEVLAGQVVVIQIPDIDMVCIGRDVGYGIVEVPDEIKAISGTAIREGRMDKEGNQNDTE